MDQQRVTKWATVDRILELVAAFTIITSLVGLIAALAGVFHAPQVLLGSMLLTGCYAYKTHGREVLPGVQPRWRHLILLALICVFFRIPVYHYILGGQDEGLYINIAQHIEHSGGIDAQDSLRQKLERSPYLQRYLQDNRIAEGDSPTLYLLGVYARETANAHLVFQFYYLFSVWMAMFAGLFGAVFAAYALTFFALLSVAFFYRLALLLTRSYHAALAAGGLLALNPLHAFFSKFPVTEVPTLAFSLIGFTLLAAYWSADASERQRRWLVLSVLAFLCLFTTRISGFMYMPFFIALAVATLACDQDLQRRRGIQRWAIGVSVVYLASVAYGLHWSRYYSRDTYLTSFEPLFGQHWKLVVDLILVAGFAGWAAVGAWARNPERRARIAGWFVRPADILISFIAFAALLLGLLKIYWLGWTPHYAGDPSLGLESRWQLAHGGWHAALATGLWTLVVYIGPLLAIAFFCLIGRRQADPRLQFLRLFLAGFFAYIALLQWIIPFGPYYARYLLSELVPYLILFVVCAGLALRAGGGRAALSAALFLTVVYATALSTAQIGKSENDGAHAALERLVRSIEPNDLILLNTLDQSGPNTSEVKTPLVYTFARTVVTVGDAALADTGYLAKLNSLYDDLFLISPDPSPPQGFSLLDSVRFKVTTFRSTHLYPRELTSKEDVLLYLYRLDRPQVPMLSILSFAFGQPWAEWLRDGWGNPEAWGVWSDGKSATLAIDPRQLPSGHDLTLQLDAQVYVSPNHPQQQIDVSLNGQPAGHYRVVYPSTALITRIPIRQEQIASSRRLLIVFSLPDAISPKSLGSSGDPRQLGIGLIDATVSIESQAQPQQPPAPATSAHSTPQATLPRH